MNFVGYEVSCNCIVSGKRLCSLTHLFRFAHRWHDFQSRKRSYKEGAKKVYKDIKRRCYKQFLKAKEECKPFNFRTDKLGHYKKGFTKYFDNVATLTFGVSIKQKKYRTPAERVKIKINLGDRFQLLNLIRKSYAED